jgi:hypothetical protein
MKTKIIKKKNILIFFLNKIYKIIPIKKILNFFFKFYLLFF